MTVRDNVRTDIRNKRELKSTIKKVRKDRIVPFLYLITFPIQGDGVLEVYNYNILLQPTLKNLAGEITVVGMSRSKKGAIDLIKDIYEEAVKVDENLDIRSFLGY